MTSNANFGAERPFHSRLAANIHAGAGQGSSYSGGDLEDTLSGAHSPEAEDLLRRYLSEIHSYRQLGNAALRELEDRLVALAGSKAPASAAPQSRPAAHSVLMRPSLAETGREADAGPSLNQRLRELSAYLHADLTRQEIAQAAPAPMRDEQPRRAAERRQEPAVPAAEEAPAPIRTPRSPAAHKVTPNAPVLDRAWFEQRFANMRASIDQIAEQIPTHRIETLEAQFRQLMEKLDARETDRSVAAVEAGLKKLAAYLEDNKQWTKAQDARMHGVEERLDQLSGLVAQSHAALSATAKGLEIVARGTGPNLARATADLVAETLAPQLTALNDKEPIAQLSSEVARLSAQSTQTARSLDERMKQLQNDLDESLDRLAEAEAHRSAPTPAESWQSRFGSENYDDEHDGGPISAAQRAARLSAAAAAAERSLPQNGEPVRYQIPYGEFLPEEENSHSRIGLIIVAIILLLASAAMLYLNLRDKSSGGLLSGAWLSHLLPMQKQAAAPPAPAMPLTTASVSAGKISERISQGAPFSARASADLWVTSVTAEEQSVQVSGPQSVPGAHAASDADPLQAPRGLGGNILPVAGPNKGDSLRQAAVDGNADAQFSVGKTYLDGSDDSQLPVSERLSKAARWFRRAAERGHAPSQYRLATLYELGHGAPKSYADAMNWYEQAANKGHIKAMHNLAVLSVNGNVRTANYLTAAKWFAEAAGHGLRDSQYNLGVLHERGLGVPRDLAKAYVWFSLAANQGDVKAAQKRDQLATRLSGLDLMAADRRVASWTPAKVDEAANSDAPEPPTDQAHHVEPFVASKKATPQLMQSSWSAQITLLNPIVAEAQRLLAKMGYRPGPADGIAGPRTAAAVREFEKRLGWPATGAVTKALVEKMAVTL
jgi:TPR repeat protein